jgi:hypothetical protein
MARKRASVMLIPEHVFMRYVVRKKLRVDQIVQAFRIGKNQERSIVSPVTASSTENL